MTERPKLTREAIQAAQDRKPREVFVPEWGGVVFVRRLSGPERDDWELAQYALLDAKPGDKYAGGRNVRARLVLATACSEDGAPLFTLEDLPWLAEKAGAALGRVYEASRLHNGMTEEAMQELEGKAGAAGNDGSATA